MTSVFILGFMAGVVVAIIADEIMKSTNNNKPNMT